MDKTKNNPLVVFDVELLKSLTIGKTDYYLTSIYTGEIIEIKK